MKVEHEYKRGGALNYMAAWDVHQAKIFGCVEPRSGIESFGHLVAYVMNQEPYRTASRVFWIVDNGSLTSWTTCHNETSGKVAKCRDDSSSRSCKLVKPN